MGVSQACSEAIFHLRTLTPGGLMVTTILEDGSPAVIASPPEPGDQQALARFLLTMAAHGLRTAVDLARAAGIPEQEAWGHHGCPECGPRDGL
jgi:hypothetical protein